MTTTPGTPPASHRRRITAPRFLQDGARNGLRGRWSAMFGAVALVGVLALALTRLAAAPAGSGADEHARPVAEASLASPELQGPAPGPMAAATTSPTPTRAAVHPSVARASKPASTASHSSPLHHVVVASVPSRATSAATVPHPAIDPAQKSTASASMPTGYGCDAALAYLGAHAAPGFQFQCPGNAFGNQAMTCVDHPPQCAGVKVIVIAVPCPAAYMNEANNSWVLLGLRTGTIDPYGYCH